MANSKLSIDKKIETWRNLRKGKYATIKLVHNSNDVLVLKLNLSVYRYESGDSASINFLTLERDSDFPGALIYYFDILGIQNDFDALTPTGNKRIKGLNLSERKAKYLMSRMEDMNYEFYFYFPSKDLVPYSSVLSGITYFVNDVGKEEDNIAGATINTLCKDYENVDSEDEKRSIINDYENIEDQMDNLRTLIDTIQNQVRDENGNKLIRHDSLDVYLDKNLNHQIYGDNFQKICEQNNIHIHYEEDESSPKQTPKRSVPKQKKSAPEPVKLSEEELLLKQQQSIIKNANSQLDSYIGSLSVIPNDAAQLLKMSAEDYLKNYNEHKAAIAGNGQENAGELANEILLIVQKCTEELQAIKNLIAVEKFHASDVLREPPPMIVRDMHAELATKMKRFEELYGELISSDNISLSDATKLLNALSKINSIIGYIDEIKQNSYISEIYPYY